MKKSIFVLLAILGLCVPSRAQKTNTQAVSLFVQYKTTCSSSTIGTTATELTGNTTIISTTAGISAIKVSNLSTTATVCCSHANTVVCTVGNSFYSEPIFPSGGQPNFLNWGISVLQGWYCAGSAAGVPISVCLVR